ncbi:MAG: Stress responsive alpha-beta barrel protein [Adhaeribacter sp.]|nr:Stress responsive alpha-beta barrel protein [Adhaeribacter sp.]
MRKQLYFLLAALLWCGVTTSAMSQRKTTPQPKPLLIKENEGLLRHVVLFKFKDSATPTQVKQVERAFSALPSKITTIVDYEWGTNMSPENLAQGFTHCFLVTFKNAADRDAYLPHPAHKEFGSILGPYLDKVLVIDFIGAKN